jgi:hypothetical protein
MGSVVEVKSASSERHGERVVPIFIDRGAPLYAGARCSNLKAPIALAIVAKSEAESWLAQFANPE